MRSGQHIAAFVMAVELIWLAGCAMAPGVDDPQLKAHLPDVDVQLPGQRPAGSAPLWRAAAKDSTAAVPAGAAATGLPATSAPGQPVAAAVALAPLDELKQTLAGLLAQGAIDRGTHDELLKSAVGSDPEMIKHITWMCRVMNRPTHQATADDATAATVAQANLPPPRLTKSPNRSNRSTTAESTQSPRSSNSEVRLVTDEPRESPRALTPTTGDSARGDSATDRAHDGVARVSYEQTSDRSPDEAAVVARGQPTNVATTGASTAKSSGVKSSGDRSNANDSGDSKGHSTADKIPTESADWRGQLAGTIASLEQDAGEATADEQQRIQAHLRLLYLAAGRKNDALRPLPGMLESEQDFWSKEVFGLATYLNHEGITDRSRRTAEASRHLSQAATRLAEGSPLIVKNVAFCSEVASYGVYTAFNKLEFKPGQQVLLYAEVENFRSDETPKGFHTALKSHYQLSDSQSRKVDEHDFALAEERCQNPRRDYFVRYFMTLPTRIYDGRYTLQLTVEDTLGKKVGQSTIDFTIKTK